MHALAVHIAIGTLALMLYWTLLLTRKGTSMHRRIGRVCLAVLVVTGLSVGPVLSAAAASFDPGQVVQTLYLTLCLVVVSSLAIGAIRCRNDPDRFRGRLFSFGGWLLLFLGIVVLLAGLHRADPVAVAVSWVGLAYGSGMIAFRRYRGALHPRWWMGWHLNATTGLFNAVNGTFMYVVARWAGLVPAGDGTQAAFQVATLIVAVALRLWFGRVYRAPLGFGLPRTRPSRNSRRRATT